MTNDLPALVGLWNSTQSFVDSIAGTTVPILQPNSSRLAFGVCSPEIGGNGYIQFLNTNGILLGFPLRPMRYEWFYWGKYGSIVSQGWQFSNNSGNSFTLTIYEVQRTES